MKLFLALLAVTIASIFAVKFYGKDLKIAENYDKLRNDKRMKQHLEDVDTMARNLEHYDEDYETESFEEEYYETVEHFKKRLPQSQAMSAAINKMQAKHGVAKTGRLMDKVSRKNNTSAIGKSTAFDAAAQFDLTITRDTVNIPFALTIPLFASIHYNAKYLSVMGNYLPNGCSISAININAKGDVVFTILYSVGSLTDTITVSCTQIPYITFLAALNYNAMRLSKIRYSISDITKLQQFNQPFEVYSKTIFGKHNGNGISLAAVNDPKYQQQGVRDIDNIIDLDNSTAVIIGMINVAGFSVSLSSFVSTYNRISSK